MNTDLTPHFTGRLIKLSDGRDGLRSLLHPEIREVSGFNAQIEFVASDETVDRYQEVIGADGWDLANYRKNPVFQNAHQYGDIMHTLGKSVLHEVRDGRLIQRIEFAVEINPMARIAHGLYRGKFLNAVSVGFVPREWQDGGKNSGFRRRFTSQELLELSAVSIPANPNALALGLKSGAVAQADLRDAHELLRAALSNAATSHQSSPDVTADHAGQEALTQELINLRRELLAADIASLRAALKK